MKNNLLELSGISNATDFSFKWKVYQSIEGNIFFSDKEIMGASLSNEVLNYKELDGFNDTNFDNFEVYNNLIIVNTAFNISIEYSESSSFGRLNLLNHRFYKTFTISLKEYTFNNIDIHIVVLDFNLTPMKDQLYYYADILIGINEL